MSENGEWWRISCILVIVPINNANMDRVHSERAAYSVHVTHQKLHWPLGQSKGKGIKDDVAKLFLRCVPHSTSKGSPEGMRIWPTK